MRQPTECTPAFNTPQQHRSCQPSNWFRVSRPLTAVNEVPGHKMQCALYSVRCTGVQDMLLSNILAVMMSRLRAACPGLKHCKAGPLPHPLCSLTRGIGVRKILREQHWQQQHHNARLVKAANCMHSIMSESALAPYHTL